MADWIKMRAGLLTNPKVIRMSRLLAHDRNFINWWMNGTNKVTCDESVYEVCDVTVVTRVTVGSLLSLWSAVNDSASSDGFVRGITLWEVDMMAGVPGFGDALVTVGWAEIRHDGIVFPNFEEHNTVEKVRSDKGSGPKTGAQRTAEYRARKSSQSVTENVTCDASQSDGCDVTVTPRIEEKREEINTVSRASRLPSDWSPSEDEIAFCRSERPDLNPRSVAEQFRDYWVAVPGQKGCKRDWTATWRNWVRSQRASGRMNGHTGNDSVFG